MLESLLNYAVDRGIVLPSGFKPKDVRWAICCDANGNYLEVVELGDVSQKSNRGQTFLKCPDFSFTEMKAQGTTKSHFLVETAEVATLHSKNPEDRKTQEKHHYFFSMLKEAGVVIPELRVVAEKLQNPDVLVGVRKKLAELKAKPTDKVTVRIGSKFPLESSLWHGWWQEWRNALLTTKSAVADAGESESKNTARCLITGELLKPVRVSPKISGLSDVGGMSAGDSLCSFKQESFCSYGFEQAYNAAVSESATNAYRAALDELIKKHSRRLAGAKVIHWFKKKDLPDEDDPLAWLVESAEQQERNAQQRAKELLASIKLGKRPDLADNFYHAMTLSGASGRVMIRDWMEGQFEELATNIMYWFDDFAIAHRTGGGLAPNPKFMAVLGATVRVLDNLNGPFITRMWRTAVKNELIPEYALAQVLSRFKVDIIEDTPVNHAGMGLIKAYHLRKERKNGGEAMAEDLKPYLNEAHPHPAYHCGRLMAVLAGLQRAALGDVGAGVVQRYFAAASTTPALVLGRLTRNSQAHLNKLTGGLAYWYEEKIAAIWGRIKDSLPKTLTLEEQSLFALGYYQQMADMRKKTSESMITEKEEGKNE